MELGLIFIGVLVVLAVIEETIRERRKVVGRRRPCPRCGVGVPVGELDCPHCGFDFREIGSSRPVSQ